MTLELYNTLTRKKAPFSPIDPHNVRFYVCGPTVYDHAHIGNARPIIVFDVLFRLLRHIYGPDHVTYVRNITDVDDKINERAKQEARSIAKVTRETTEQFHKDIATLGVLEPTVEPRATGHIDAMKAMIEALVEKGHAYVAEGHVLFDVSSAPDYGALSGRSTDEMIAGARVDVAPYKRGTMDFVLWKPSSEDQPGWPSPCGIGTKGRPGWHIECSAMAKVHLGDVFDIHGGGIDLTFPHHENEIAQSRCAHGTDAMAKLWMHNGYLQVEGEKMSKSLGNFITINELLRDWPGEVLRLNMLRAHYRQPLDWTISGLEESAKVLRNWFSDPAVASGKPEDIAAPVFAALCDDLNTPLAIAELHRLEKAGKGAALGNSIAALGFEGVLADPRTEKVDATKVDGLIAARNKARADRDFAEADRIREELDAMGLQLKDDKDPNTGEPTTEWEVAR